MYVNKKRAKKKETRCSGKNVCITLTTSPFHPSPKMETCIHTQREKEREKQKQKNKVQSAIRKTT